jgi:hypothetical protein
MHIRGLEEVDLSVSIGTGMSLQPMAQSGTGRLSIEATPGTSSANPSLCQKVARVENVLSH